MRKRFIIWINTSALFSSSIKSRSTNLIDQQNLLLVLIVKFNQCPTIQVLHLILFILFYFVCESSSSSTTHYRTRPPWAAPHRRYLHLFAAVTHRQTYSHFTAAQCRSHDLQRFSRAVERSKRLYDVHGDHTVMSAYIPHTECFGFLLFLPLQCSVFSNLYKVMKHVTQFTKTVFIYFIMTEMSTLC